MPSFSIALTGLQANSIALSTIGNDLANLNTTAFKNQTVNFADLFYQNVGNSGSNAPLQVGIGTRVSSIDTDYSQGSLATTGNATDMALNGSGFFVVDQAGSNELTRAGNFQLSSSGDLTTSDGNGVQGYPAVNGAVDLNAPLQTLNVPTAQTQLAQATSQVSFTTSLNSSSAVGTSFTSSTGIYDSLGQEHNVNVVFTKTASNQWGYNIALPSGEATGASNNTGTLTFNPDGTLASPTSNVAGVTFTGLSDNANNMTFNLNIFDSAGNSLVTQGASASTTNASSQNGYASGTYESFAVGANGTLTATFTNGGTEVLGQLAIATVSDPQALTRDGSNLYSVDMASGTMDVGVANTGGRGSIAGDALEQSNVDISTEFADLIVAQRAFEANSKTVTAFDTVTQDTINLIR
jgi:flagellar hook protein FlgE